MLRIRLLICTVLTLSAGLLNAQNSSDSSLFYYCGTAFKQARAGGIKENTLIADSLSCLQRSVVAFSFYEQNKFKKSEEVLKGLLQKSNCPGAIRYPAQALLANLKFLSNNIDSAVLLSNNAIKAIEGIPASKARDQLLATLYLNLGFFTTPRTVSSNEEELKHILKTFDAAEKYIGSARNINGQFLAYLYLYRALALYNCGQSRDKVIDNLRKAYRYNRPVTAERDFSEISGYLFYNLDQVGEAVQFLKGTDLNPWYGMALVKSGKQETGLKLLADIIESPTPHPYEKSEACYFLSEYYLERKQNVALDYFRLAKEYNEKAVAMEYSIYNIIRTSNKEWLTDRFGKAVTEFKKSDPNNALTFVRSILIFLLVISLLAIAYFILRIALAQMSEHRRTKPH